MSEALGKLRAVRIRAVGMVALALLLGACASATPEHQWDVDTPAPEPTTQATTSTTTSTPSSTPKPSTPARASSNEPLKFLFRCGDQEFDDPGEVRQARAADRELNCDTPVPWGGAISPEQEALLERNPRLVYSLGAERVLGIIYNACTSPDIHAPIGAGPGHAADNFLFAQNVVAACPDHPQVDELQARVDAAAELPHFQAELEERQAEAEDWQRRERGEYIEGDQQLSVGSDISAGTWETVNDRVRNCYWHLSDAQGGISDYTFISVGERQTITIPESATGFTTRGCGSWRMID